MMKVKSVASIAMCLISLAAKAQRGTGANPASTLSSASVQQSMFAPSLSVVSPPTPKTNLFYNIGLAWDSEINPAITGYKIRYGTNMTTAFTNSVITSSLFCTVSNLQFKPTWYFQAFTLAGTNVSEGGNIVQIQPPLEANFVVSSVFPIYSSTNAINWSTSSVLLMVITNPVGSMFFRSHFRQLDYQWTNNQIIVKPFTITQ